jgi:hypothetical protein
MRLFETGQPGEAAAVRKNQVEAGRLETDAIVLHCDEW